MAPNLTEDEIDDLLYFSRTGDTDEYTALQSRICAREDASPLDVIPLIRDPETGNGVLHMASGNGYTEFMQKILTGLPATIQSPALLALLNAQNRAGNTSLHYAALNGHLDAVRLLLEQGADPTVENRRGHDAVYEAEVGGRNEVVEWILREGEGLEVGVGGEGDGDGDGDGEEGKVEAEVEVEGMVLREGEDGVEGDVEMVEGEGEGGGSGETKLETQMSGMDIGDNVVKS